MATARFSPGDVLRGKYRIKRVLGEGGMGVVVRATHLRLEQDVAIKVLREEGAARPLVVERFAREARAAARLRGEHAVRILDVDDDGTEPFLVMEYLDGSDLERIVRTEGPLEVERAVDYLLQACAGLAEAHALGIVHRDVKPANLFLARRPRGGEIVKILDFGISKAHDGRDTTITDEGRLLGSPAFMSPEQVKAAREVDARTDGWSLGVTLHFLLSGRLPFDGDSANAVSARIASEPPASLAEARPGLARELLAIVERCLTKEREGRFESVAELARALAPFAESGESAALRVASILRMPAVAATSLAGSGVSRAAGPQTASLGAIAALPPDKLTASLDAPGPVSLRIFPSAGEVTRDEPPREEVPSRSRWWALGVMGIAAFGTMAWIAARPPPEAGPRGRVVELPATTTIAAATTATAPPLASPSAVSEVPANADASPAAAKVDAGRRSAGVRPKPRADASNGKPARPTPPDDPLRLDLK